MQRVDKEDYDNMTVKDLKSMCESRGLSVGNKKKKGNLL